MNWKQVASVLAGEFNFQPSEIMNLEGEDFFFWADRLEEYQDWKDKDAN